MIIVHHLENSRSQRVLWLLEELGINYEVKRYERDPVTGLGPKELYDVHPLGKSPVVQDGEIKIAETGAIFEYLLHTYDKDHKLSGLQGSEVARGVSYWLHYAEGSAMVPLLLKLVFLKLPDRSPLLMRPVVKAVSKKTQDGFVDPRIKEHADYWEASLATTGYFVGNSMTAADIMMSFPLEAAASRFPMENYPSVAKFVETCHARPAYQRALEKGGPYAYA